jgi:hypothetical protein
MAFGIVDGKKKGNWLAERSTEKKINYSPVVLNFLTISLYSWNMFPVCHFVLV